MLMCPYCNTKSCVYICKSYFDTGYYCLTCDKKYKEVIDSKVEEVVESDTLTDTEDK
jgi:hypothetical protein